MLIHLTTDRLCQWHPYDETLSSLNCKYCIVDRSTQELRELFGACEHSYGHWIDLSLPHGRFPLYQLLRRYFDVAPPPKHETLLHWGWSPGCLVKCRTMSNKFYTSWWWCLEQWPLFLLMRSSRLGPNNSEWLPMQKKNSWDMVRDALIREITFLTGTISALTILVPRMRSGIRLGRQWGGPTMLRVGGPPLVGATSYKASQPPSAPSKLETRHKAYS